MGAEYPQKSHCMEAVSLHKVNDELISLQIQQKAVNVESLPAPASARALEQRRCLLLAVAGATPRSSQALEYILANDYLAHVKKWLSDITSSKVGTSYYIAVRYYCRLTSR